MPVAVLCDDRFEKAVSGITGRTRFCVIVSDRPTGRLRWRVAGHVVDLILLNTTSLSLDIRAQDAKDVPGIIAAATPIFGDRKLARHARAAALAVLAEPATAPRRASLFRHRTEPFDLLRSFDALRKTRQVAAGLVLAQLVVASVDAYFGLGQLWRSEPERTLNAIRAKNPRNADLLEDVIGRPLQAHCDDIALVEAFVAAFAGSPTFDRDFSE